MVHSHKERFRMARMANYMVHYSCSGRVPDSYSEIQEKMVFCNYSRSNYCILAEQPNS